MLIYFLPLLYFFYLYYSNYSKQKTFVVLFILMTFICFGYMTGSDWREYEDEYYYGFRLRSLEPGYMFLSETLSNYNVNFWFFHIGAKCLSYIAIICVLYKLIPGRHLFFGLMLWYSSYGLFMFINCPFRNMIACGIVAVGYLFYLKDKVSLYVACVALAISFHMSAIILFAVPLIRLDKVKSSVLVGIYMIILIVLLAGGGPLLISILQSTLPAELYGRIDYYSDSANGSVISIGLIPRLICFYLIIRFRDKLKNYSFGMKVFNLCYFYLVTSLVYYVFPMLFRSSLFLAPFYVAGISLGIREVSHRYCAILRGFFLVMTVAITFSTVASYPYVPYTNIIPNIITNEYYDYSYRYNYNLKKSPYKNN